MNAELNSAVSPALAEGLSALAAGAVRITSIGLSQLPQPYRDQVRRAVDEGTCQLSVQIDVLTMAVRVLADGEGWAKPQCLFACELPEPVSNERH